MEKGQIFLVVFITLLGSLNHVDAVLSLSLSTESVLAKAGENVWVDCIANPKFGTNIRWEKDSAQIPLLPASGKGSGDSFVLMNNTLKLINLKRRQAGTYVCIATSGTETRVKDVVIQISYIQKLEKLKDAAVFEGEQISIECVAPFGNPSPKVRWRKNGKDFSDPRIDQSGWTLQIKNAALSDTANYTCVAMGVKNRTESAELIVYKEGSPVATPKMARIVEGKSTKLECVSKADPPLPVTWKKIMKVCDDKSVCRESEQDIKDVADRFKVNGGILEIMKALPADAGNYSCIQALGSQFETVQVTLEVIELVKVKFNSKEESRDMYREKSADINCPISGDNPQSVEWKNQDGTLPSHMKVENSKLIIMNPQLNDTGVYRCTVKGPYNTDYGDLNITIYISPKFTVRPANVTGTVGQPIWVHCKGTGNPTPSVNYWGNRKGGGNLNKTHYVKLPNGTMKIDHIKIEDAGGYFCWLKHDYGSISSDFIISVLEPKEEEKGSSPMHRTIGIAVGCAGVYILLVIGLMIYCRARRARLLKGIITEVDGEGNVKDPLVGNEAIPLETNKSLDQWEFSRDSIEEIETLGHGKMGRVFKANALCIKADEKKTLVAVKEFQTDEKDHKDEYHLEVEMFTQLNHENVVRLLGVTTQGSPPWYLITDYGEEGDLKQYLNRNKELDASERLGMSISIASGMDYLVKQRYIHRDLAARNCVVKSNKNVMISFLSLCEDIYQNDYYCLNDVPVPLRWLSPEAIQSEQYSEKSDVWSYGVTVWEIFASGEQPYTGHDNDAVLEGVCKSLRLPIPAGCQQAIFDVMQKCWNVDPENRPSFVELTTMVTEVQL